MDAKTETLAPAAQLARANPMRIPNESPEYRTARTALLAQEIELRRQIERVAAQRRALPPGGPVTGDYRFEGEAGPTDFAGLFGDKQTLIVYSFMFGPERERPCPMCTNLLGPLNANATDITQRVALAVLGRSKVDRQLAFAQERGWHALSFIQTVGDDYARDFSGLDPETGSEWPVLAVFHKEGVGVDATVRLFWKGEMTGEMADEGKDPRGGPDFAPLWTALDLTPEGRGEKWYPKLNYS